MAHVSVTSYRVLVILPGQQVIVNLGSVFTTDASAQSDTVRSRCGREAKEISRLTEMMVVSIHCCKCFSNSGRQTTDHLPRHDPRQGRTVQSLGLGLAPSTISVNHCQNA